MFLNVSTFMIVPTVKNNSAKNASFKSTQKENLCCIKSANYKKKKLFSQHKMIVLIVKSIWNLENTSLETRSFASCVWSSNQAKYQCSSLKALNLHFCKKTWDFRCNISTKFITIKQIKWLSWNKIWAKCTMTVLRGWNKSISPTWDKYKESSQI